MDVMHSLPGLLPGILAATPSWLETLDGANLVIGVFTLLAGLLGIAYLVLTFISTPQPQTEPAEPVAYPGVDRFLVPLILPVGVALVVALIILLMSQILLVVPEAIATPIALGVALLVLIVCAVIATAPRVSRGLIYASIGIPLLFLIIAGGWSGIYRYNRAQAEAAAQAEREANAPATALQEVTTDNKFSRTALTVPAGQQITMTVTNNGVNLHNWHVLDAKDANGNTIATPITQPGQKDTVTFTISAPGKYNFQCDVHPTEMTGTLTVQ